MTVREELAEAANSVEGIRASPYYVQGSAAGHAFVRLDRMEWPNKFGAECFWNVIVVLPKGLAEAEKFMESKVPLLYQALAPHMTVTEAVPQQLNILGVGDLLCVFINGHREE